MGRRLLRGCSSRLLRRGEEARGLLLGVGERGVVLRSLGGLRAAAAAAADAFVDDAASVDTSVCSERQTEWVWRSGLDVSECVDDWGWEDALAERKKRLLAEFVGDD